MNLQFINFTEVDQARWDALVAQVPDSTYQHCWYWIDYSARFSNLRDNRSFVLLGNGRPLAVCPLGVSADPNTGSAQLSFGGNPCASPVLNEERPTRRRHVLDDVLERVRQIAAEHHVQKVLMISHPLSQGVCAGSVPVSRNMFDMQKYDMIPTVISTRVMDLSCSEEVLEESLSRDHRARVRKNRRQGIRIQAVGPASTPEESAGAMRRFQEAHLLAAGRLTRPQGTWDAMLASVRSGRATLFISLHAEIEISFLFCGEYGGMAFSWSQVNVAEYQDAFSPRHLLEWEAILHYRRAGFRYYELGDRFLAPQLFNRPSAKEITISQFKERYGGLSFPKVLWVGYLDRGLMAAEIAAGAAALTSCLGTSLGAGGSDAAE